jgi:putative transposon-encoded protein
MGGKDGMAPERVRNGSPEPLEPRPESSPKTKAKFEVWGEEMIEKEVKQSGNSGRVYLPPEWVGKQVKIIRLD